MPYVSTEFQRCSTLKNPEKPAYILVIVKELGPRTAKLVLSVYLNMKMVEWISVDFMYVVMTSFSNWLSQIASSLPNFKLVCFF